MEEILASIRRIIADDDAKVPPTAAEPMPPVPAPVTQVPRPAPPPPAPVAQVPRPPHLAAPPPPIQAEPATAAERAMEQAEIDAMLTALNAPSPVIAPMPPPVAERPPVDVLELTEAMAASASVRADGFRTIDGRSDVMFEPGVEVEEEIARSEPAPKREPPPRSFLDAGERPLISSNTSAAVDSAFNTLAHTVLVQNARTLEDLVREMLRPLLKTWLDDNLPGLVERLVRAEIERVSRGRT